MNHLDAVRSTTFGQLPALLLTAPDGAQASITLYGAHLISWRGADGRERLFCSAKSALDGSKAIRGGVPVIFPQFAERGAGMRHGFARVSTWRAIGQGVDDGWAFATLALAPADLAPAHAQAWPHGFELALRIAIRANELTMRFEVRNTGAEAFPFAAALHTYFLVDDIASVRIDGVETEELAITGKFDRVYEGVAPRLAMVDGGVVLTLRQEGFADAVVWNPGAEDAAALADMADEEYRRFVCIEPALLDAPALEPGQRWAGKYHVS
ncbi:D-hexose-6-phosphate mutarotase [Massilia sp. Leaf139]|uniref:aldose epimerase family protein n=1 Tax=Massilia sp. Leaf139 TaxID=1736272 RepID=UPI000701DD25|nr:D-hexose-6-phosphate mutarotase [Massilia sp. Leaf139]KQQ87616.1 D-hexose-6-phosphate mutarotase [Massilia sp. Leaf139]